MALLEVEHLSAGYGEIEILHDITITVQDGDCVTVLGANAAGKTTLLRSLSGLLHRVKGTVRLAGSDISSLGPEGRVASGLVHVPENRLVFPFLSVLENLRLGAYTKRARARRAETMKYVLDLFPILHERRSQMAGLMSGGEQQMLAIGRGLMAQPSLLMLDEPSLGLAPVIVERVMGAVRRIHAEGTTVLIVEQNVDHALDLADRAYVLENGRIVLQGLSADVRKDDALRKAYLGL